MSMDMNEAVAAAMREYLMPGLEAIKSGQARSDAQFSDVNKRLDDMNAHLVDQSRRIDETNNRIDAIREELTANINSVREELKETNKRMDRLYKVIVRREEHSALVIKINEMDHDIRELKQHLAA